MESYLWHIFKCWYFFRELAHHPKKWWQPKNKDNPKIEDNPKMKSTLNMMTALKARQPKEGRWPKDEEDLKNYEKLKQEDNQGNKVGRTIASKITSKNDEMKTNLKNLTTPKINQTLIIDNPKN